MEGKFSLLNNENLPNNIEKNIIRLLGKISNVIDIFQIKKGLTFRKRTKKSYSTAFQE